MSSDDPEKLLNNWLGELDSLIMVSCEELLSIIFLLKFLLTNALRGKHDEEIEINECAHSVHCEC